MSTLQLENIKHPDASGNTLELGADGSIINNVNYTADVSVNSHLKVGKANIIQQYPTSGYVADFQASAGNQTYISIGTPQDATLGNTGLIIGVDPSAYRITGRENKYMRLATNDLDRFIIEPSGHVTTPYQPWFSTTYTNASSNLAGSTGNGYVVYNNVVTNNGGYYNNGNGRFTAPVNGLYCFSWTGIKSDSTGDMAGNVSRLNLHKNGSQAAGTVELRLDSGDSYNYGCATHVVYLTAGDYVQVYKSDSGGLHPGWASFSGYLVG